MAHLRRKEEYMLWVWTHPARRGAGIDVELCTRLGEITTALQRHGWGFF